MFEYCTLQEAYNVPSFESARKKKASGGCGGPKTSAAPFDAYSSGRGREQALARREPVEEGFEDASVGLRERRTYRDMSGDYTYYGKEYDLRFPKVEGFADAAPAQKCGAAAPQIYEVPVTPESKAAYDKAVSTSLNQSGGSTKPMEPQARKVDMSNVTGYYDEELEQYLQTNNATASPPMPAIPKPSGAADAKPYDPESSPFATAMRDFSKDAGRPMLHKEFRPDTTYSTRVPWWDIVLFVLAGLLIIFLCEQLFRVAVMIGMRRTVDVLEPFLVQISK
jgi:hypothetical protein